jgi:hypothetical protein
MVIVSQNFSTSTKVYPRKNIYEALYICTGTRISSRIIRNPNRCLPSSSRNNHMEFSRWTGVHSRPRYSREQSWSTLPTLPATTPPSTGARRLSACHSFGKEFHPRGGANGSDGIDDLAAPTQRGLIPPIERMHLDLALRCKVVDREQQALGAPRRATRAP